MARKNSNSKVRRNRKRFAEDLPVRRGPYIPPTPVEQLVVPVGRCYLNHRRGKLKFTADQAAKALSQARHSRAIRGSGYVEERYYPCDGPNGCGQYHLTSQEDRA